MFCTTWYVNRVALYVEKAVDQLGWLGYINYLVLISLFRYSAHTKSRSGFGEDVGYVSPVNESFRSRMFHAEQGAGSVPPPSQF